MEHNKKGRLTIFSDFCSKSCRDKDRYKNIKNNSNIIKTIKIRKCVICKIEHKRYSPFCSLECYKNRAEMIITFLLSLSIQLFFDLLPILIPSTGLWGYLRPWLPVLGVFLMAFMALNLIFQMWYRRDRLKKKYGQLSYQKIFLVGVCGIAVLFSI